MSGAEKPANLQDLHISLPRPPQFHYTAAEKPANLHPFGRLAAQPPKSLKFLQRFTHFTATAATILLHGL
ncbi:hypothetical protein [Paenibacillus sp. 32O-W]|uniref:hypothetical protein n=1 Tax=Paenibacillus sp. 32O-W TaxID=1695218 RepID=UPI001C9319A1|nr:hypothetical protein [Paenibacillus sp. 32O-W]